MNYWFEVFHNGRYEKCDSFHEAVSTAKELTSSERFVSCVLAKNAYIVKHAQIDNSDELVSITHVQYLTNQTWLIEDLM